MSSYIGKIQIESGEQTLIGSTLYGTCSTAAATAAKEVTLSSFDALIKGITVHVRFINGNSVTSNLTLKVGSTTAQNIVGNCVCNANDVVAFTYWEETIEETLVKTWYVNSNIVVAEGSTDGTIVVNGQSASVHGLGSAAYTNSGSYATAAQGTKADNAMPTSGGTFTGSVFLAGAPSADREAATKGYVDSKVAGFDGLTGAMHFIGVSSTTITNGGTQNPTINNESNTSRESGDVVIYLEQEYVWNGSAWQLLGDEGSYALKSSTDTITEVGTFTANTLPTLTVTNTNVSSVSVTSGSAASLTTNNVTIPNVTNAGTATTASVTAGVLNITLGTAPTLAETPITVKEVNVFTANTPTEVTATPVSLQNAITFTQGTQASLTTNDTVVVVPNTPQQQENP